MSVEEVIQRGFEFFSVILLVAALVIAAINTLAKRGTTEGRFSEQVFRWTALLAAGVVGVFTFVMHVFDPERASAAIGWQPSPFEFEVGMADLAFGVLGIMAFWGSHGFRLAATINIAICLWGDAIGHVYQMIVAHNFEPGNAGPWFWTDVLVPAVLIISLAASGKSNLAD